MQDTSPPVIATPPLAEPAVRRRSGGFTVFVALFAFVLGAGLVVWLTTHGYVPAALMTPIAQESAGAEPAAPPPAPAPSPASPEQMAQVVTVEGRLAMIEDRLSRIGLETDAAAGNAGRAEGLLIAFAARRMVDRGEPLGYVADQLRLRFTNAQPRAVQTIVDFAARPVTIDGLSARLEALSAELTVTGTDRGLWERARHEIASLFVVRRDSATLANPVARIERARVMLTAKRMDAAIGEVERLPGADAADTWIADARRYEAVQKALNLLETTAMLEPSKLQDGSGHAVDQPSPLAPGAPDPEPESSETAGEQGSEG